MSLCTERPKRYVWIQRILCSVILIALIGCAPPSPTSEWLVDDLFEYGQRNYEDENYLRAMEAFRIITLNYTTSDLIDDAMFNLGEAHRQMKEYPIAAVTFRRLIRDFPQSPFADDSQYNLARSLFEQSSGVAHTQDKTFEAIRELQIFLDEYPDSEVAPDAQGLLQVCLDKLAEKDYQTGHLYFRLQDWESARLYFSELMDEFPSSKWSIPARYELSESYVKEESWDDAVLNLQVFLQLYPEHELVPAVKEMLKEIVPKSSSNPTRSEETKSRLTKDGATRTLPRPADSNQP
ncbi:MAG: outer membrane protein assembly factor BamD [Candidatus Latescibacteria bacterium]|nr:outer membrane protein assembly factor BamD [Candidatus Latescibacterota bacterium]